MSKERKITVVEDATAYVGVPKGTELIAQIFNPDTAHEIRIMMGPLQAIAVAQQLTAYAEQIMARDVQVVERYEHDVEGYCLERERPDKLDA